MVGLDAAGKTTILYKLKLGEIVTTIPTIGQSLPIPCLLHRQGVQADTTPRAPLPCALDASFPGRNYRAARYARLAHEQRQRGTFARASSRRARVVHVPSNGPLVPSTRSLV